MFNNKCLVVLKEVKRIIIIKKFNNNHYFFNSLRTKNCSVKKKKNDG